MGASANDGLLALVTQPGKLKERLGELQAQVEAAGVAQRALAVERVELDVVRAEQGVEAKRLAGRLAEASTAVDRALASMDRALAALEVVR